MTGLVLADFVMSEMSLAVTVAPPTVFSVTAKDRVPATSGALDGNVAAASLDVMPTVSVTVLTRFQLASTALTATLNAVLATCAPGVPVLPEGVPGDVVSPGTSNWSFVNAPGLTAIVPEVALLKLPLV